MATKRSKPEVDSMRDYEIRNAMDTLQRAECIKKDKTLMAEVKRSADDLQTAIGKAIQRKKRK